MRCPFCRENRDRVIDSRESSEGDHIRRRRECENCNKRFTTRENITGTTLRVVKRNGTHEDFERRKILMGLLTACQKRPVSLEELEDVVQDVEEHIRANAERDVTTEEIGELVMRGLRRIDKVAYVRFASVYKNFESAQDFEEIVNEVGEQERRARRAAKRSSRKSRGSGRSGSGAKKGRSAKKAGGGRKQPSSRRDD